MFDTGIVRMRRSTGSRGPGCGLGDSRMRCRHGPGCAGDAPKLRKVVARDLRSWRRFLSTMFDGRPSVCDTPEEAALAG